MQTLLAMAFVFRIPHWHIEVLLLLYIVGLLARIVSRKKDIGEMGRTIATMAQRSGVPLGQGAFSYLPDELARARRYERELTVAVIRAASSGTAGNGNGEGEAHPAQLSLVGFAMLACLLRSTLRKTDALSVDAALERFILVLPELSSREAVRCLARLKRLAHQRAGQSLQFATAEFPRDGYTSQQLLEKAVAALAEPNDLFEIAPAGVDSAAAPISSAINSKNGPGGPV